MSFKTSQKSESERTLKTLWPLNLQEKCLKVIGKSRASAHFSWSLALQDESGHPFAVLKKEAKAGEKTIRLVVPLSQKKWRLKITEKISRIHGRLDLGVTNAQKVITTKSSLWSKCPEAFYREDGARGGFWEKLHQACYESSTKWRS